MVVGDGIIVVVGAVVVLVEHIHGRVYQGGLHQRGACTQGMRLLVVVTDDGRTAGSKRIRHRGAAHVLVGIAERETPAVVLIEPIAGIGRAVVPFLIAV